MVGKRGGLERGHADGLEVVHGGNQPSPGDYENDWKASAHHEGGGVGGAGRSVEDHRRAARRRRARLRSPRFRGWPRAVAPSPGSVEQLEQGLATGLVEPDKRLVDKEHLERAHEGDGDGRLHAARWLKVVGRCSPRSVSPRCSRRSAACCSPTLCLVQLGDVLEMLPHGQVVVEHRLVTEVAGERPGVERTCGMPEHRHRPGSGVEQAGGEAQQRRLAAAVVPGAGRLAARRRCRGSSGRAPERRRRSWPSRRRPRRSSGSAESASEKARSFSRQSSLCGPTWPWRRSAGRRAPPCVRQFRVPGTRAWPGR